MNFQRIEYTVEDRLARIMMNRPEKRNALDDIMVQELTSAVLRASRDPAIKVLSLSARGPAFCAGADLEYLERLARYDMEQNRSDSFRLANLYRTIYELRKPIVAVVNGPALAGGCGLASVCDFVIASEERARFGYTEVHVGFIPALVMVFLVKRIGEGRARELILRGNTITAPEAYAIGLVSAAVPEASLESSAMQLITELLQNNSATSMAMSKEMLARLHGLNLADALDFAANMNAAARMTPDCKQGIQAFLSKRKPIW